MTGSRQFNKSYAAELVSIAEQDLLSAEALVEASKGRPENALFMIQQVAEKSLKGVICHLGMAVPFSHDIEALIVRIDDDTIPHPDALAELTPYATIRRYEEGRFRITSEELRAALDVVRKLLQWSKAVIGR